MKQNTKEFYTFYHRIVKYIAVFLFVLLFSSGVFFSRAEAASLRIHNYVTNDTYDYTDTQISYRIGGTPVSLTYPGILSGNGSALGPCEELFSDTLGITMEFNELSQTVLLTYGSDKLQMTLGNSQAYINGKSVLMPCAPALYSFSDTKEKYVYVPSRFVAETFGFTYSWDSTTATSTITRTSGIYDGNRLLQYNDVSPELKVRSYTVNTNQYPVYLFENQVFVSVNHFKDNGLAAFSYSEGSGLILMKKGDVLLKMVLDSPIAYINGTPQLLPAVPRLITPAEQTKPQVYVPAMFVAKALEYEASYDKQANVFSISGTGAVSENEVPKETPSVDSNLLPNTESFGAELFSYDAHEQIIDYYTSGGYLVPSFIGAYACVNSDALYLQGIPLDKVRITDKQDVIEIEILNCHNPFGSKFYYDTENAFINYCCVLGVDSVRILLFKTREVQFYSYNAPNGCVIHFTDADGLYEDYLTFVSVSEESDSMDLAGSADTETVPEAVFSRDYFVIPLPEGIDTTAITDTDDYLNLRFTLQIPGNHLAFLSEQDAYQPSSVLTNYRVNYKHSEDVTILTFQTSRIQAYNYCVKDGFLGVKIANPKELYDKIIVLDAGHGGIDPGTSRGSVMEKTVNFNVINRYAEEYFKDSEIKVYYTRTTDTKISLDNRAAFASKVGADLFISFHVNAHSSSSVGGTYVYYSTANNGKTATGLSSSLLATEIGTRLSNAWGTRNRGNATAKFIVVHNNTVPAVLVECGFITNDKDFAKIKDPSYQKKAAKALYEAVEAIFEQYPTGR